MEKKSQAQQELEARNQVKGDMAILEENNKKNLGKKEFNKIIPDRDKIEPYTMPNVSKRERAEVVAKSLNTRDCFGRKLPKESEHTEAYYIKLQEQEERLIQNIERGLDICEEDGYDIAAIKELEEELAQITENSRKGKIDALNISINQLCKLDAKIQELVDRHEQGLKC